MALNRNALTPTNKVLQPLSQLLLVIVAANCIVYYYYDGSFSISTSAVYCFPGESGSNEFCPSFLILWATAVVL